jgi:hypothetical protein
MVDNPPSDPNFVVPLGTVVETGATGKVFVNIIAPRPTGGMGIAISGNSVAADLLGSQDGTGVAFSFSGLEFGGASSDMIALLQGCADENILKWDDESGGLGRWDCAADVSGGSPSLNTVTAAVGAATINSGDNAIVWNWSITTASKIGFKIGENVASVATTDPILFNIATLAASTAHPLQVTARGTADGIRVGATDGVLVELGSGGVDFGALLNYPSACVNTFVRAILDAPTCNTVGTSDLAAGAADNTIIRDSAGFSVIGKSTTGSGDPADIVAADETVLGRTGAGNLIFAQVATGQVANDAISDLKLRNSTGFSVIGKATTGSGDPADIVAGDETVFGRTAAGNLVFAQVQTGQVANNAITFAKMQDITTDRLLGRDTAGSGDAEEISLNATLELTGSLVLQRAALTGDVAASAGSNTTAIQSGVVGSTELATANKTFDKSIAIFLPTTADDDLIQWMHGKAVTYTDVDCSTDQGTATIDMDHRVITTPNTVGTDILTGTIVCDTDNQADGGFADATIPANVPVNLSITAVSGTPGVVRIHVRGTVD